MLRALGVVVAFGIAIGAWFAGRGAPEQSPTRAEIEAQASAIGGWLREQSAALHARASTLADLPLLAAAVSTDAATVRDLTSDELAFRPKRNETIELGQLRAGSAALLLRLPDASTIKTPLTATGVKITLNGDRLLITETLAVTPREQADVLSGMLAVSWSFDAATVFAPLRERGAPGAILVASGSRLPLGTGVAESVRQLEVPVATSPSAPVLIAALGHPARGPSWLLRSLAVGAALVGIALLSRRRRSATPPAVVIASRPTTSTDAVAPLARPEQPPMLSLEGSRFGRYEPLSQLGVGASASVFLARAVGEAGFEKRVALKILHPSLARDPELVASFLDEARLASNLSHPNIVQIYDLGRSGDDHFIAMEHVDGCDLERVLEYMRAQKLRMPVDIALAILRRICDGLDAAHTATDDEGRRLAIVHRDVKPANVLVSRSGSIKVGDFGIAKGAKQLHRSDLAMTKGTISFMAPEQRMGRAVDARADLFSAAAVGYELLTGIQVDLDMQRLLTQGVAGWPHLSMISALRADAPPELDEIVFRALAYNANDRQASCAAFEDELAAIARTHRLDVTDRELASWLATEIPTLSPTLRGWSSDAAA